MKQNILLLVFLFPLFSKAQSWTNDFTLGQYDINGKYLGGTEVMSLTPHKGKLYAATSYVCDLNFADYNLSGGTPVLALDSANGQWRQEILFEDDLLIPSLKEFVFTKDYLGNSIAPDTVLMTGPNNKHHHIVIYVRNDSLNQWIKDSITTVSGNIEIRSMGTHYDTVTGHQYVLIGVSDFGIWRGEYDGSLPGKIRWDPNPEFTIPDNTRVPAITDVNGVMYFGTTDQTSWVSRIYRREDGPTPTYDLVYLDSSLETLDIRGLSAVKSPTGNGEELWFYCNDYFRRLQPFNNDSVVNEMQLSTDLTQETGRVFSGNIIAGYNDHQLRYRAPGTTDTLMYIGLQAMYDSAWLAANPYPNINGRTIDGMYYTRKQVGANISYQLNYIVNNTPIVLDTLLAVRTICVSPFASDSNKFLFAGGYHTNAVYLNNTAWIYRGNFTAIPTWQGRENDLKISFFPNPAHEFFNVELPKENYGLQMMDLTGRQIFEEKNLNGLSKIDCRDIPGGVYLIQIHASNNSDYLGKLIVLKN